MRLALDPGETTGVGYRAVEGALRGIQWPGADIMAVLEGMHAHFGLDEIVVEDFISRPGAAVNLSAPRVIGRILAWAEENDVPVIMQQPSAAKTVITKDRLRALGGWVRGMEHARDALRHLLYREQKLGLIELPPK
jgi:hypothetical protein